MKSILGGACVALLGLATTLAAPSAQAGVVGDHNACSFGAASANTAIVTAGHTRVQVNTLDEASLAGLDALVIRTCPPNASSYMGNAAVNNAVAAGMGLMIDVYDYSSSYPAFDSRLPGSPTLDHAGAVFCPNQLEVIQGSPAASGPGGPLAAEALNPTSLCTIMWTVKEASLPPGAVPFVRTPGSTNIGSFGYPYGDGLVAYTMSQFTNPSLLDSAPVVAFMANVLTWVIEGSAAPTTTCASEGYTGTKLEWCKNICERGYTGSTLAMWIRRWTDRYRTLPYCALEDK